jgi:hypothetical protein
MSLCASGTRRMNSSNPARERNFGGAEALVARLQFAKLEQTMAEMKPTGPIAGCGGPSARFFFGCRDGQGSNAWIKVAAGWPRESVPHRHRFESELPSLIDSDDWNAA